MVGVIKKDRLTENTVRPFVDHHYVFLSGHLANLQSPLPSLELIKSEVCLPDEDFRKLELAMDEALANAIEHGNLELDSSLREEFDEQGRDHYSKLREARLADNNFASRLIHVHVEASAEHIKISVRDEGKGFNTRTKGTAILESNLSLPACSGRGLILIRAASDEVSFNEKGNELIFIKRIKG